MKKILNIFGIISLITSGSSSVIGCSHHHNPPATKEQEEDALVNFARQNGIQEREINKNNWSFQNETVIDEKENIDFSFEENHNAQDNPQHSQLLKEFKGQMTYDLENKTFSLDDKPFENPTLIPGYYNPSLHKPSTITGNKNEFTIAAGAGDLSELSDDLSRPDTQTLSELFNDMHWKNVANFEDKYGKPLLKVSDLENLQKNYPQAWQLPQIGSKTYMALIHVIKTNGKYHIVWSNLDSDQDKKSLFEPDGDISSVFWKDTNYYHLWCSQQLVQEIAQIYELPTASYWFQSDNLNKWLQNRSIKEQGQKSSVGVQTINTGSSNYNTSIDMLDQSLQHLNNNIFANWVQNNNYKNYDLVFNKDFSFNAKDSQELD